MPLDHLNMSNMETETTEPQEVDSAEAPLTPEGMVEEANEKFATAFMDFNETLADNPRPLYFCFVEGYDRDYYHSIVSHLLTPDNAFINCGGKSNVIKMHTRLSSNDAYSNIKTLYFVDRDYDDNSTLGSYFFITDHYSVENYYCSESVLTNVLQNYCHINLHKEVKRVSAIRSDFNTWLTDFYNITKPFCAWYRTAHCRNVDRKDIDYKDSFPLRLAKIDRTGIVLASPYDFESLNSDYNLTNPVTQQEYDENFQQINHIGDIRGKFVLQFMEAYILHLDMTAKKSGTLVTKTFNFSSHRPTFMIRMVGCADISDKLKTYIINRK